MKSKPDVFLSYADEDCNAAEKLNKYLEKAGVKSWMKSRDLLPGHKRKAIIHQAIKESSFFVALLSSNSVSARGYVQKELKKALAYLDELPDDDIFIIPVRLDDCEPVDERLQSLHCVDIFPSYEKGVEEILRVLTRGPNPYPADSSQPHTKLRFELRRPLLSVCLVLIVLMFGVITYCRFHPVPPQANTEEIKLLEVQAREKRERIELLYKKLEDIAGPFVVSVPLEKPSDEWTSKPVALAMVFDPKISFSRQEKGNFVAVAIQEQILKHSRVKLVEHESFDIILKELILAKSKPQFLMPELILILEINNADPQPFVLMRLDHTKKREVVSVFIEKLEKGGILPQKTGLSENLLKKLKHLYPLRGRILGTEQGEIILNIGDKTGVKMGQKFKVTGKDVILKVVSVQADTCTVRMERGGIVLEKGWHVEEI
ncbi:MAG: toll/interleukin-1 receptor domain-containing protein [Desulfobacterales bacterium]|nr:toll/interleukin-1 receptor domain-containing protein [Desulfobacterales bacterium]